SNVASRALVTLGFGAAHPYGHPTSGFRRQVETFARGDVEQFHFARFQPPGALLAVVAPDEPAALAAFARGVLQRWESKWPKAPLLDASADPLPPPLAMPRGEAGRGGALSAVIVHKPESTQAQVRIVAAGVPRNTPG